MKVRLVLILCAVIVLMGSAAAQERNNPKSPHSSAPIYDPARNPDQDLQDVIAQAGRSGKRILLDVGGEWCIWCHRLDAFFDQNRDLMDLREKNFIMLKINY